MHSPPELYHELIQSLCLLVAAPGGDSYMKQAIQFLDAEDGGLLAHRRFQRDEVLLVIHQLAVLAKAVLAQHGKKGSSGKDHRQNWTHHKLRFADLHGVTQSVCV